MNLADYLESKAEYIFDNYRASFHGSITSKERVKPEDLNKNRKVVVDRLKRGLRGLGEIHDRKFWDSDVELRHLGVWFTGEVNAYWGKKPNINTYNVDLTFPNWSVAKILIEKYGKKFEDLFRVRVVVYPSKEWNDTGSEFSNHGFFATSLNPTYIPANFLFSTPIISKLSKYKAFNIFNNTNVNRLFYFCKDLFNYHIDDAGIFRDFTLLLLHIEEFNENLLVTERIGGSGVDLIKLDRKEYYDIIETIEYIRNTEQLSDKDISIKDVLSRYIHIKIKGNKQ